MLRYRTTSTFYTNWEQRFSDVLEICRRQCRLQYRPERKVQQKVCNFSYEVPVKKDSVWRKNQNGVCKTNGRIERVILLLRDTGVKFWNHIHSNVLTTTVNINTLTATFNIKVIFRSNCFLSGISLIYFIPEIVLVKTWPFGQNSQFFPTWFKFLTFFLFGAVRFLLRKWFCYFLFRSNRLIS